VTRRGARGSPGAPSAYPRPRCPSLGDVRPMLPGEAIPRAPSLYRGGCHQAHRPRFERGDAPVRGTRRGSTESMAPWRHLTAGIQPGRARLRTAGGLRQRTRQAELAKGGDTRSGRTRWRAPRCRAGGANHLGDTRCASSEWARPATVVRWVTNPQESFTPHAHACSREGKRGPRRELRAEEDSRLAGVPARRHALQRSVGQSQAQRSPCETPTFLDLGPGAPEPCADDV